MMRFHQWLLIGIGASGLCACDFIDIRKTCAAGIGVQTQAYTGTSLEANELVLTFSGGPGDGTSAIDAALFAASAQGTFFVNGNRIVGRESTLTSMKSHGHLIANFGYTDTPLAESLDPQREVRKTDALILPYVSGNIFLLRAVGAANLSEALATDLNKAGLSRYVGPIGWDIGDQASDAECWRNGTSVSDCAGSYLSAIQKAERGIVRMHGEDARTGELLQKLLPQLKELNYRFVRLDAVSSVQTALKAAGATIGAVGGDAGCSDY